MARCFILLVSLLVAMLLYGTSAVVFAQATRATAPSTNSASALDEARKLIQTGHAEQALQQLDALTTTSPDAPGLQRSRGSAFYALDKLVDADAAFARALQADPRDQEAAQMRGLTLYRLGRPAAAIPLLEGAHEAGAQSKVDPTYVLALCYMDTRRYDDARHAFAALYGIGPDSAPAYLLAARMLLRREYVPVALTFATRGVELDPKLPLAHALLGEIALAQNRTDDAVKELEQERALNPLEGVTYERLGDAYSRASRYPEAQKTLQQAVLLEPNSTGPYILLGKVTLKQGDAVAAATYLQRAEAMDQGNYMTHNLLAQAYKVLGRTADAARELQLTEKIQAAQAPHFGTLK